MTDQAETYLQVFYSHGGKAEFLLAGLDDYVVGRRVPQGATLADVGLEDPYVFRRHCRLFQSGPGQDSWLIDDAGSGHDIRLNGLPVLAPTPIPAGGEIHIGTCRLTLSRTPEHFVRIPLHDRAGLTGEKIEKGQAQAIPEPIEVLNPAMRIALEAEGGLLGKLIRANLLDRRAAIHLLTQTQQRGFSLFTLLARDSSLSFISEIYQLVAREYHLELIEDERLLSDLAVASAWLPFNRALEEGMVLLRSTDPERLRYGTIDPFNLPNHDWVVRCGGKPADKVLIHPHCFEPTLNRLKDAKREDSEPDLVIDLSHEEEKRLRQRLTEVSVPQLVDFFLSCADRQKASDCHVEPTEERLVVRNRLDGILHEELTMPLSFHPEVTSRLKIMSRMDVAEKRRPQDGRFGVVIRDNPIDVRVSTYPTVYGEKIVLRLLDRNALRPSLESLGLLARDLRMLKDKLAAPYGLMMISGPTGSGKTTSLYSCLASMDKKARNILTVEDPVEYRLKGVHQMQVNQKIGLTFASGLRTILRQDPDVIMVGEIRDAETASMAVQASLTGHIVFSTIHTNDAVGVITRMLDMGLEPFLVATSLSLAIAQRLVRKICPNCRAMVSGREVLETLRKDGVSDQRLFHLGLNIGPDLAYSQGLGCRHCRQTGYSGRRAVYEVFEMTEEARHIIMSPGFNADAIRDLARKNGMTTLIAHGMKLVEEEVTTVAEVIRVLGE